MALTIKEERQILLNRRTRPRMYGGVEAAVSDGDGYPISANVLILDRLSTPELLRQLG